MELLAVLQGKKFPCSGLIVHVGLLVVFGGNVKIASHISGVWAELAKMRQFSLSSGVT